MPEHKLHKDSFKWIWGHGEYTSWSRKGASRLLYIEGNPGSGKSTLTKYFSDHLLEREEAAKSATVARFFYSNRDGELQKNHSNMLRSILYDILRQEESFFYPHFQTAYRGQRRRGVRADWEYNSLKTVLESLRDHSSAKPVYLIIDAVDESEEKDRRDVLKILFELCGETKNCIVKAFVASRPVGELEVRKVHNKISLQVETETDISNFADSFLDDLKSTPLLAQAKDYIVKNAQGVFLWVKLVGEELLAEVAKGSPPGVVFEFLKGLPTELEGFYAHMFQKMDRSERALQDSVKMFRFVLFARRPLLVDELLHTLGIPDNPDEEFTTSGDAFWGRKPFEHRILYCGGNFLEIKQHHGISTTDADSSNP